MRYLIAFLLMMPVAAHAQQTPATLPVQPAAPLASSSPAVKGQEAPPAPSDNVMGLSATETAKAVEEAANMKIDDGAPAPEGIQTTRQSLFFSPNQVISILRYSQGYIVRNLDLPDEPEVKQAAPIDTSRRTVTVSGIVYRDANDWTVWLNGERVTPKNKPEFVMGMRVEPDKVHIRWMDMKNKRIVNFTLRSHQTYQLDTDTIVSGT